MRVGRYRNDRKSGTKSLTKTRSVIADRTRSADEYLEASVTSYVYEIRPKVRPKIRGPFDQPRSQSSSAISDVTSPDKLVGKIRLGQIVGGEGKFKRAEK